MANDGEVVGEGPGRLALVDGVGRGAAEGRAAAVPAGDPELGGLQPRACRLFTEAEAEGVPLLLNRLGSGCHFCPAPAEVLVTLALRLILAF